MQRLSGRLRSENASSGRLQELENNDKSLNFEAQKVVAVAYGRSSFTRISNCKALSGKVLVFWIGGRLWEVVAYERWSRMEVQLYCFTSLSGGSCYLASLHEFCFLSWWICSCLDKCIWTAPSFERASSYICFWHRVHTDQTAACPNT